MPPLLLVLLALCASMADGADVARFAQRGEDRFRARLATVPIDLAMQAGIAGQGSITAVLAGDTLTITGDFTGLKSAATVARLHASPVRGMRGPVVFDLMVTGTTSGAINGKVPLTPQHVDDLKQGRLYVQLHSEKAPDGNLWGWLLPQGRRQ